MSNSKYEQIEALIQSGQSAKARSQLQKLSISKIPRNRLSYVASLCRSSGIPEMALKVLKPLVHSQNPHVHASASEIAQYGQSLISLGGSEEAIALLNQEKVMSDEPKALLFLSFAYFAQWNYQAALPHLEAYLQRVPAGSYIHGIGQVNYAAALIAAGHYDKAEHTLIPLIDFFKKEKHQILAGNGLELLAQIYFHRDQVLKARPILEQATQLLGEKLPDSLFVKKWQCLIKIKSQGATLQNLNELEKLRNLAEQLFHWETIRDIDFHKSLLTHDISLYNQVYFGSPFPQLREKIKSLSEMPTKKTFIRNFSGAKQLSIFYDIQNLDQGNKAIFKTGSLYHRLFLALTEDFYRPLRLPTLFAKLYPDECFEPESSSQKLKMLISRLRKRITPLGFQIIERGGAGYILTCKKPVGLVYRDSPQPLPQALDSRLSRVKELIQSPTFKSQDIANLFNISPRSASRWLKAMTEEGLIEKLGDKKGATYKISRQSA